MTQEEKILLLQDLCGRLPYGVKVWYKYSTWHSEKFATSIRLVDEKIALSSKFNKEGDWFPIEEAGEILIKPYLRPLSSMTEEERQEYNNLYYQVPIQYNNGNAYRDTKMVEALHIDWLNKNMFDFRRLPKDSIIEASEEMYNN